MYFFHKVFEVAREFHAFETFLMVPEVTFGVIKRKICTNTFESELLSSGKMLTIFDIDQSKTKYQKTE
jgi:hypothetical protein